MIQKLDRSLHLEDRNEIRQIETVPVIQPVVLDPSRHRPEKGTRLVEAFCGIKRPAHLRKPLDKFLKDLKLLQLEKKKHTFTTLQKEAFDLTVQAIRQKENQALKEYRESMTDGNFTGKRGENNVLHDHPCRSSLLLYVPDL